MKSYIREKSLVTGIIGMTIFFLILSCESNFGTDFFTYYRIGYAISLGVSLLSLYFAIKATFIEVEEKKTKIKIILFFCLTNFMMCIYAIFKVYIGLWNIAYNVLIVWGSITIFEDKAKTKEKIKLLCAFLLATIIAYVSCSRMTTKFTKNEYMNIDNPINEIVENVEYDYLYDENLANQIMETYNEVHRVAKQVVKKYNSENYQKSDNINENELIYSYCYSDVEQEINIISDAGEVMDKKVFLNSAFDDYEMLFFRVDFEGEFYNVVKEYNVDTDMFSDYMKEKLKYIVCDEDGNLFINPSYFITRVEKSK